MVSQRVPSRDGIRQHFHYVLAPHMTLLDTGVVLPTKGETVVISNHGIAMGSNDSYRLQWHSGELNVYKVWKPP